MTDNGKAQPSEAPNGPPLLGNQLRLAFSPPDSKKCSKCGRTLPTSAFYAHAGNRDRLDNQCKTCRAEYSRRYRATHRAECAERDRLYQATHRAERAEYHRRYKEAHKDKGREALMRYYARYPERGAARNAVKRALRNRTLVQPDACELCGEPKGLHVHHHDYSRPLDVVFLCALCHKAAHAMADSFTAAVAAM